MEQRIRKATKITELKSLAGELPRSADEQRWIDGQRMRTGGVRELKDWLRRRAKMDLSHMSLEQLGAWIDEVVLHGSPTEDPLTVAKLAAMEAHLAQDLERLGG